MPWLSFLFLALVGGGIAVWYLKVGKHRIAAASGYRQDGIGGPDAPTIRAALKRGDVSGLNAALQGMRQGQWNDRTFTCDLYAKHIPRPVLDSWCQSEPQSAVPFLLRGFQGIHWAFEARGGGMASEVSDEAWEAMAQRMEQAELDLRRAAELDPDDPSPYAGLLDTALHSKPPLAEAQNLIAQARQRDPENYLAHMNMLVFLCEKWHGSHGAMFEFVRQVTAQLPPGSDLWALMFRAHIERWLYADMFDKNKKEAAKILASPEVAQEIAKAHQASVGSAQLRQRATTIYLYNEAAFWYFLVKDKNNLRPLIMSIGNAYNASPWRYWDEPERAYGAASQMALKPF